MSWHGPWVLAEIFVGWGGGQAKTGPPHVKRPPKEKKIAKKAPTWRKRASISKIVAERPSHDEKAPHKEE